jgi:ribosomal protein S17E
LSPHPLKGRYNIIKLLRAFGMIVYYCVVNAGVSVNCPIFAIERPFMMRIVLLLSLFITNITAFAAPAVDTVKIPIFRQGFHDKVNNEQKLLDRADGKVDQYVQLNKNEEINLHITDAAFRKIDELQNWVETNEQLVSNNDKIRYLRYIEDFLRIFRAEWRNKEIKPVEFPALYNYFDKAIKNLAAGKSFLTVVISAPYESAKIVTNVFDDHSDTKAARELVYLKYSKIHPENILKTIRPFADASFADSLVVIAAKNNPVQLYSYAQSTSSAEGKLIHRNANPMVKTVVQLSQTNNALFYFPFLDDLLSGKKTIEQIKPLVGDGITYDSLGYYKLLVSTEIEYYKRMAPPMRDTPIAMFGPNGLRETLKGKAMQHIIKHINELHDVSNLAVRMKAIQPLSPTELYYMMIMGEADLYTSSYKHSFNRMLQLMGTQPRGDSLLQNVHFDYFKKFIKMAANYNKLDTFLKTMPLDKSEILMKAFVANLDKTGNLEDAVDVADSYSSINDKKLLNTILGYVTQNKNKNIAENNQRGLIIYGLLETILLSADSTNKIDLTETVGIPSIYEIGLKELQDEKGRIVQQVFFYGDEDGKTFFPPFVNSFSPKEWKVTMKKEWVEIESLKGDVFVYANRPLDYDANLDDSAQVHLAKYLESLDMHPSVVVHRGHSYWLPGTIKRMPNDAKIVVLGSCGGYQNLNKILESCPDAHIVSTKEIGAGDINRPILNYMNQTFISGSTLYWKRMWQTLTKTFSTDPSLAIRESWDDYVPPYKNLGAIFIKAYTKRTGGEEL